MPDTLTFEHDIRPLFREEDRDAMSFAFDLWSYDDVSSHADAILGAVQSGQMPCDAPWDDERIARFRRWTEDGKAA